MISLNILIIDDEINIRKTLTVFLESRGHHVKAVSNSKDAFTVAELQVFDLAFVDLRIGTDYGTTCCSIRNGAAHCITSGGFDQIPSGSEFQFILSFHAASG